MADAAPRKKRKVLVPIDFTPKSEGALDFALTYSERVPCELFVFFVFEESTRNFRRLDKLNQEYMDRMKQMVINALHRLEDAGIRPSVDDVHQRMAHGKAASEIQKMAEGIDADMIFMGSPKSSSFKKLVINAPCTIVLYKDKKI